MILLGNEDHQSKLLLWLYVLYAIGLHIFLWSNDFMVGSFILINNSKHAVVIIRTSLISIKH